MIVAVPALTPVTIPVLPTVAAALLLLHVPPPGLHVRVVVAPSQTVAVPLMLAGDERTVTTAVCEQPALTI